jgi:hypothetical protein
VFLPSLLCHRGFAFARIGVALPGMGIAKRRHKPPRYDQAGHGNDQAGTAMSRPEMTKPGTDMVCDMIRPEGMSRPEGKAIQNKPGTDMICDMIRPEGMSRPVGTAMQTKPGTDIIRPKGMSRPKGTAMSRLEMTIPGTGMICEPEGMSRPVGTAMQTKPGTDMICDKIRPEGTSRPEGTAMQTKPGTAKTAPK